MRAPNLKKIFLYLLIASVAFSAAVGIGVLLFGDFGDTELKILLTTLIVTMASILGLACGAYLESGRGRVLPLLGIVLSVLSAVLWIVFIWDGARNEELFVKVAFSATLLAASCSHLSLLSIARLDKKFGWAFYAAHLSVWSLTAILLWIIWADLNEDSETITRVIGVLSIAVAALTIVTPVFHRLSGQTLKKEEIDAEIARLQARIEELLIRRSEITENDER